jgi:hypothetical protein
MFARTELVPTAAERAQRYYEGIDLGGSLYDSDASDIAGHRPDPSDDEGRYSGPSEDEVRYSGPSEDEVRYSGPSDEEGRTSGPSDMDVSDQQGRSGRPLKRRRRVRFTLPRQPRPEADPVGGVGGHHQVRKNI